MRVAKLDFNGNPNVGLYGYCVTNQEAECLCLLGERVTEERSQQLSEVLDADLQQITIAGTPLIGVFLAGNQKSLLVPNTTFDHELSRLRALGLPASVFHTKLTCLGNNIIANEHGCLVNPAFTNAEIEQLRDFLGVPVKRITIAGLDTPGAVIVLNGKRGIIHRDAAQHEIEMVKETLLLESLEPSSVNLGSPYLRAGILNNEHGFIVGALSGGPEIVHIEEALGYLEEE